ncbi:thioesterase family protein [Pseudonocardia yuanmonensis]|uniref:Thioesterase family protein n=1 Tax=Pseudonocardia yuanmonensis TaxID=1095914 RepID=A0ABP8WSS1_9PSEU
MTTAREYVHPWQVRYLEVDQQGVVFNSWYLAWFDEAMSGFLAHSGPAYGDLVAAGYDVQLVRSEIDWRSGVGWGDPVSIAVSPGRIGTTSFDLHFEVRRGDEVTCTARTVYVVIATDGSGTRPIPDLLRKVLDT